MALMSEYSFTVRRLSSEQRHFLHECSNVEKFLHMPASSTWPKLSPAECSYKEVLEETKVYRTQPYWRLKCLGWVIFSNSLYVLGPGLKILGDTKIIVWQQPWVLWKVKTVKGLKKQSQKKAEQFDGQIFKQTDSSPGGTKRFSQVNGGRPFPVSKKN